MSNHTNTRLSALPSREVVGEYVVGPYDVRFQVEVRKSSTGPCLVINGNGYPLIALDPLRIFMPTQSPLHDGSKSCFDQSWPLRGEG